MKIKELKRYVDKAYKKGKDCKVEVWFLLDDDTSIMCDIDSIGQFHIIPDMTITFKISDGNNKIYCSEPISKEQMDYRKKYNNLKREAEKISEILREML